MTYRSNPVDFRKSALRVPHPVYTLRHSLRHSLRHLGSRTVEWAVINATISIRELWRRHRQRRWRAAWRILSPHQLRDLGLQPATVVWLVDAPRVTTFGPQRLRAA